MTALVILFVYLPYISEVYDEVINTWPFPYLRLGLIWVSRDDTRADMEKAMYKSLFIDCICLKLIYIIFHVYVLIFTLQENYLSYRFEKMSLPVKHDSLIDTD